MQQSYHTPALLEPCIKGLNINPEGTYVDLTFGGGGHSQAILNNLSSKGKLIVFDQDKDAWDNRIDDPRLTFVKHNFRYLYYFLKYLKSIPVDGILADLGVSSHHFDVAERGFSFRFEGKLDMRMNRDTYLTASKILNTYSEDKLINIFKLYGEIPQTRKLVKEIILSREKKPYKTTSDLKLTSEKFAPRKDAARFYSQVFQALRIEVNGEMDALKEMLIESLKVLNPGGRLAIISYHSLEDRLVKNFFKTGHTEKSQIETDIYGHSDVPFKTITRKVIVPDSAEIEKNPRARSAKLRIAEKK